MLELIIDEDIESAPACPRCHASFSKRPVALTTRGATCPSCGAAVALTSLTTESLTPPKGMSLEDTGSHWSIAVSTRSKRSAFTMAGVLGYEVVRVMPFAANLMVHSLRARQYVLIAGISVPLLLQITGFLLWWYLGKRQISGRGPEVVASSGIGPWAKMQSFSLPLINGLRLTRSMDKKKDRYPRVLRVEGVGFFTDIAWDLRFDQQNFLALFLLQKRLAA